MSNCEVGLTTKMGRRILTPAVRKETVTAWKLGQPAQQGLQLGSAAGAAHLPKSANRECQSGCDRQCGVWMLLHRGANIASVLSRTFSGVSSLAGNGVCCLPGPIYQAFGLLARPF